MYALASIYESDQMGQCVSLIHGAMTLAVSKRFVAQQVLVKVVPVLFHAMIRAVSMLVLRSDIETKMLLCDSRSITPTTDRSTL